MFVETKEAGEVQQAPAKVLKLSEAIRKGHDLIREERDCYLEERMDGDLCGCAIGAAAWALGYREHGLNLNENCRDWLEKKYSHLPEALFQSISDRHHFGWMNRLQIVGWLESMGY